MRPIGDGAEGRAAAEDAGFGKHSHQSNEAAIRAAIDADAPGIHAITRGQKTRPVHLIAEVFAAHVPVDGRAPVAAISFAGAKINVEYGISVVGEEVVKHELPRVGTPPAVYVL